MSNRLIFLCLLLSIAFSQPRLAIVIDDLGTSEADCTFFAKIPVSLNCAVIPGQSNSRVCANIIKKHGQTLLIHFPWENLGKKTETHYPIRISSAMTTENIKEMFTRAFMSVPGADGINNHMGSVLSKNPAAMQKVMIIMSKLPQKKFFLDSHTSNKTKAYIYAYMYGISTALNNYFLDGIQNEAYIKKQFGYAVAAAEKNGYAIAICHGNRPATKRVFQFCISHYNSRVDYVSLESLVKTRELKE